MHTIITNLLLLSWDSLEMDQLIIVHHFILQPVLLFKAAPKTTQAPAAKTRKIASNSTMTTALVISLHSQLLLLLRIDKQNVQPTSVIGLITTPVAAPFPKLLWIRVCVYKYFNEDDRIELQPPIIIGRFPSDTYYRLEYM